MVFVLFLASRILQPWESPGNSKKARQQSNKLALDVIFAFALALPNYFSEIRHNFVKNQIFGDFLE